MPTLLSLPVRPGASSTPKNFVSWELIKDANNSKWNFTFLGQDSLKIWPQKKGETSRHAQLESKDQRQAVCIIMRKSSSRLGNIRSRTPAPRTRSEIIFVDTYTKNWTENNGETKVKEVKSMNVKEVVFHVSAPNYLEFLTTTLAKHDKSLDKVIEKKRHTLVEILLWL
ncbi:hypothetical protein BDR04DRAFT_1151149 [Suillus decipiens]|nr:hypothetical protein BDR04DRAFT_1151149 [Suillus decipiens]